MDGTAVTLVCSKCAASISAEGLEPAGTCPHCGHPLIAKDADPPDATDDALIADLRDALADAGREDSSQAFAAGLDAGALPPMSRLGDFEILGELGRGGMGVVYRARQVSLGREVALKVLPGPARHGRAAVQRFRAEAQAAARLHHTNVVSIYAQGEHRGHYYYAMELVDGIGLEAVIRSRPDLLGSTRARSSSSAAGMLQRRDTPAAPAAQPAPPAELDVSATTRWTRADFRHVAALLAEVADALDCAHRHGVIHRDVKPHNLLFGVSASEVRRYARNGAPGEGARESSDTSGIQRLHLTDFGLARLTDEPHLTLSGEVMGTPAYLSPEQVSGHSAAIDHRTDIYSLGVTLYELLTRHKPFEGQTREQIMAAISTTDALPLRHWDPQIPVDLETICLRAMAKDPARRHPTAALLAEDLRRFAEGRPILSRRVSRLEKAGKWTRRHKALTAALTAAAAVVVLASGWAWSANVTHRREAQRLLDEAWTQLAYHDFRKDALVKADIDRAEALGAEAGQLHLVRALAAMGRNEPSDAIRHLDPVLGVNDRDLRALYLLSWAQYRDGEQAASQATFAQAEQLRVGSADLPSIEPMPDAWFFRGLAIHFLDPVAALESYREANAARVRQHAFYPQATLHLARARNQQIYSTRRLDAFPEAVASLEQLADQGYYEALPYYLLSIAHRLAAEVYRGSEGTRDDQPVTDHYAAALNWARRGQEIDPADDRPVTAEADCLESMGEYAAAIDARTRAIAVADANVKRCESYHYRWRLYYWTEQFDAALADVATNAECDPNSPYYAHFYPALIEAERGNLPAASEHARAMADATPTSAQAVLRSAACLRLLGQADEAAALLTERAASADYAAGLMPPQTEEWIRALYHCSATGGPLDELEALARQTPESWKLVGEAYFQVGALRLAEGDREGALDAFLHAYRSFDSEKRYTYHAKLLVIQMQKNLAWPPWVAVSWAEAPGAFMGQKAEGAAVPASPGEENQ